MYRRLLSIAVVTAFLSHAGIASAAAPDMDQVAATLETIRKSVNARNFDLLEPHLAQGFNYQDREGGLSRMIMRQVVEGYPNEIKSISILGITADDAEWAVSVRIDDSKGAEQRNVRLNDEYLIVQADIADIQLAGHGARADKPTSQRQSASQPETASIPFNIQKGQTVVQAQVNGVAGNFLVDTGAQATVVNTVHFDAEQLPTFPLDHGMPSGVGGAMTGILGTRDLDLVWGNLDFDVPRALAIDLSHLEASLGIPIVGLIGIDLLERFEIRLDYAEKVIDLYRLGNDGHPVGSIEDNEPAEVVSFDLEGHIPVFPVEIGGQSLRLGLDTGAADAMLFEKWEAVLADKFEFIRIAEMRGADKAVRTGSEVRFDAMRVNDIGYEDMIFRFNDIVTTSGKGIAMDGLLGFQFLSTRPTSINFRTRQLKIW